MFHAASQNRIFQDIVDQIQEAILEGRLQTGDILPSERDLKEMFNTSRGTLREALRVLEQKGLIEIKLGVGGGSVVKEVSVDKISESLALLIRTQRVSLNHLAEFREAVEGIIAAQAAERATPADIKQLKELLEKARKHIGKGKAAHNDFIEIDKQIHLVLSNITGNPIYISLIYSVHQNIHRYYDRFLSMDESEMNENYQDLKIMVRAVEKGHANQARIIAQNHVHRFNRRMKDKAQEERDHDKF
ncbi:MAG: FadR family transcriptional regulator [Deltaproteobacteria bacterium]|nr:FadR family transcriptional regulator [Deltaproteobacteria bacterium]